MRSLSLVPPSTYLPSGRIVILLLLASWLGFGVPVGAQGAAGEAPQPSPSSLLAPFALTPEMGRWAHGIADGIRDPEHRLRRLWRALLDPRRGGLQEQVLPTPTAAEAFHSKQANCVSLATLLVSLGREVGVPAFFVTVGVEVSDQDRGDLRLQQEHLATAVGPPHAVRIFDFAGEESGADLRWHPVSDLTALALFHSNRGVEALLDGKAVEAAEAHLRRAVQLDPALPVAWVNLGVALRRRGDGEGAEAAYRQALKLDPETPAAYRNLAALLAHDGRQGEAAHLAAEAARVATTEADPLRTLHRARRHLEAGEIETARRWYEKALLLSQ